MTGQHTSKKSPLKIPLFVLAAVLLLGIVTGGVLYYKFYEPGKRSADLQRLAQESYQGVFLSMYAPEAFPEDIYPTYMGYEAVGCSHRILSFSDLSDYLTAAFSSGNEVTNVLLVLDPMTLWNSSLHQNSRFYTALDEKLLSYIDAHPETAFTILFSTPSLQYWQTHADADLDTYCNLVQVLNAPLSARENVGMHFASGEEWLIANPDAYATPLELNAEAARSTMLLVLSGALPLCTTDETNSIEQFRSLITEAIATPAVYPDLSDYNIVYFGDSVLGNYHDFASIPGVISALTGAHADNLAIGGSFATQLDTADNSFPSVVQRFLSGSVTTANDTDTAEPKKESPGNSTALPTGEKLCFVINYGLNDYFSGYTVKEYCEGLSAGIQALQTAYPEAEILIVSSNFITSFDNGTAVNNDLGEVLEDFVTAAGETAADMNVHYLNVNDVLQWDVKNAACYLVDAVHPNAEGRFLFSKAVIKALGEILP